MKKIDWEDEFRPKKFQDVRGQPQAVKQVAGRIPRGVPPRPQLLVGAVGSGKTTLIRIAASALNCVAVEPNGSPCGNCEFCADPSRYLVEWDTTGKGGHKDLIKKLIEDNLFATGCCKYRVLFFDECHALTPDAQDALLKLIEDRPPGIAFYFATTEPNKLKKSLLSRLDQVNIYPLSPDDALTYLEWIAEKKKLSFEPDAFHFLIAAKPPYARDLVIGLQSLAELNVPITVELVKEQLGLQVADHLCAYMHSLALGDRAKQVQAMKPWLDDIVEKRIWVERYLTSVYYNDVLGLEYIVHPLVHGLVDNRREFMQAIRRRLDLDDKGLKFTFEAMMKFWSQHGQLTDSGTHIAFGLFETMLNERGRHVMSLPPEDRSQVTAPSTCIAVPRSPKVWVNRSRSQFLSHAEVQELLNKTSYFAQEYGRYLNASIHIAFQTITDLETHAERKVMELLKTLDQQLNGDGRLFAATATLEREQGTVIGRVLAYVEVGQWGLLEQSCVSWSKTAAAAIKVCFDCADLDCSFQRERIRELCASCEDLDANGADVRRLLGIPRAQWRDAGPFQGASVYFSECLSDQAIEEACYPAVAPLPAYDLSAFRRNKHNWEIQEAPERKREITARRRTMRSLEFRWKSDPARLKAEQAALLDSWLQISPEQRIRRRKGWL